jgi:hypothetical protein
MDYFGLVFLENEIHATEELNRTKGICHVKYYVISFEQLDKSM